MALSVEENPVRRFRPPMATPTATPMMSGSFDLVHGLAENLSAA